MDRALESPGSEMMDQSPSQQPLYPLPYRGYPTSAATVPLKNSRAGTASFIVGLAVTLGDLALIVAAAVLDQQKQSQRSPAMIITGLLLIAGMAAAGIGIGLGVFGLLRPDRKKLFAILGLCLNGVILLTVESLMMIGLSMKK
jgi:hypothetical protein